MLVLSAIHLWGRSGRGLVGLRTQMQNAEFFERNGPKRKPWPRGNSLNRKKWSQCVFLNANILERKALNRKLSWGFPLGNLLPKTRVLKHRVWERKRRPNANASVLGTQRFRTLSERATDPRRLARGKHHPLLHFLQHPVLDEHLPTQSLLF